MGSLNGVCDMSSMIRAVEPLPVPAGREENVGPNATRAGDSRQMPTIHTTVLAGSKLVATKVGRSVAPEAGLGGEVGGWLRSKGRVPDEHAEAGLECFDHILARRNVVGYETSLGLWGEGVIKKEAVGCLRHALIRPVAGSEVL